MIKKLKTKFIMLSMISLFVLLLVIVAGMNIINYQSVINEADDILKLLSVNEGVFPDTDKMKGDRMPHGMSPELPYESRFFSVLISEDGAIIQTDTSRIKSVDTDDAVEYADEVFESGKKKGFADKFRYIVNSEGANKRITFLDCGRMLDSCKVFLTGSIIMSLAGLLIVFLVIFFFAGKIIHPIAESYEKQKRFITDAGHEIKTPLTIINANVDLLELELGENESLSDIQQQVKRLTGLTNDLVYLARMEETNESMSMIEFPLSDLVYDTIMPFKTLALAASKQFTWDIEPLLTLKGNDKAIEQLVSVLMDNAVKYSAEQGIISVELKKNNKNIYLRVFNTTDFEVKQENMKYLFDRFYRNDTSRNSRTGGHGIGLSVAKAIVNAHGGKISANAHGDKAFYIDVILPI